MPGTADKKPRNKPVPASPPQKSPARASTPHRSTPGASKASKSGASKSGASKSGAAKRPSGGGTTPPAVKAAGTPRRNWKMVVGLSFVMVLLGFCCLAGFLDGYGQRDRARRADAIVVLGARVGTNGTPGQVLRGRTLHAVQLYKRGIAPKVIFTGGVGAHRISEARAAATLARKQGVPARDIILESRSTSTWENARFTSWICKENGWQTVVIVSDPYHLWRAQRDFKQAGLTPYVSPAKEWQERYPPRRMWMAVREAALVLRDLVARP